MSRRQVFYCDRCGKQIESSETFSFDFPSIPGVERNIKDLCGSCSNELCQWIGCKDLALLPKPKASKNRRAMHG